ncbi:Excinuclease ABC subunit A [Dermacoccus nishinomiyaensis]|nr:Excinuclease ABC subunit A [Dermacoccus nishinomiyaensis]
MHASRETGAPTSQDEPLLDARNTLVAAELDMRVVAVADHVIDLGPGAGDAGGTVVAGGTPAYVADKGVGASAGYLAAALQAATNVTSM